MHLGWVEKGQSPRKFGFYPDTLAHMRDERIFMAQAHGNTILYTCSILNSAMCFFHSAGGVDFYMSVPSH